MVVTVIEGVQEGQSPSYITTSPSPLKERGIKGVRWMDKNRTIELLNEALGELGQLRSLSLGNQQFELWYLKVVDILEVAFSKNSSEYERFVRAVRVMYPAYTETERWKEYNRRLDEYETALLSILYKHDELLRTEAKPPTTAEPAKAPQSEEEKVTTRELELVLEGTPDMILECVRNTTERLNSQGYTYGFRRISGAPDYAKWDKTYFVSCAISQGDEGQIGAINLQLLPKDQTLLSTPEPKDWESSFGLFLSYLLGELKRLGFVHFEEEKPPLGFRPPHKEKNDQ